MTRFPKTRTSETVASKKKFIPFRYFFFVGVGDAVTRNQHGVYRYTDGSIFARREENKTLLAGGNHTQDV